MNSIYLSFDGVGNSGHEAIPKDGSSSVWDYKALEAHYDNCKLFGDLDEVFLIETAKRAPGVSPLVYYQYLRCKGVKDRAGRTPSVFGVTIATDTFCPDYEMMLSLCRDIFHKCVVGGKLLTMNADGSITWLCNTLSDPQAVTARQDAEDKLVKIIIAYQNSGMLTDSPVAGWTVSPHLSGNNEAQLLVKMNPSDLNGQELASLLKAGKKVAVSGCYDPKSVHAKIAQANTEREAAMNEAKSLRASLEQSRNENVKLSEKAKSLDNELRESRNSGSKQSKQLKEKIEALETQLQTQKDGHKKELEKYKAEGNYACQKQLDDLAKQMSLLSSRPASTKESGTVPKRLMLIAGVVAVLILGIGFLLGRHIPKKDKDADDDKKEQAEQRDETEETILNVPGLKQDTETSLPQGEAEDGPADGSMTKGDDGTNGNTSGTGAAGAAGASSGSERDRHNQDESYVPDIYDDYLDDEQWLMQEYYYAYSRR